MEQGIADSLQVEARRHADLRHRRHAGHREDHEPAQGRLGQLPAELLHAVRAGRAGVDAADLPRRRRALPEGAQSAAWLSALVQQYPNVLAIDVGEIMRQVQIDHRAGARGRRVRVPVHAARRAARAAGGDRGHAGRAPFRRGDPAHARRVARAALRRAGRRVPRAGRARRTARRRGRDGDRLRALRSRLPDPVLGESDGLAATASAAARSP